MKKLLALAIATLLLPGCELALLGAAGGAAYTAFEDRRTSGSLIDDEAIEVRATSRIDERYGDKAHVNVTVFNRTVLLTGEVPNEAAREDVEKIVGAVPNVRAITNELQVGAPSSLGARTNDAFITSKIKARFLDAKRFNPVHVKVVTEAGIVYLFGLVTEKEADAAVEIARTTGGVRKVVRIFEYCKPDEQPCRPRPSKEKS
ncbi:MAG TPA: BON domain-containing protein [Burkholderiales bacterium]|nr:BON domain-containing protein [Burkholderiales bacterium]